MIHLHSRATPNGRKVAMALEETGLPYTIHAIDLSRKEQKTPEFLALNPNGKVPVLIDEGTIVYESSVVNEYLDGPESESPH